MLSIFKARRPLKPERRKRPQVRGAALSDQKVNLIVHLSQAFHVPIRQNTMSIDSSPTFRGELSSPLITMNR